MRKGIVQMFAGVLLIALGSALIYRAGTLVEKQHSYVAARYAAEWGCLVSAQNNCGKLGEPKAYPCMDEAIVWCPTMAEKFEKFLRH